MLHTVLLPALCLSLLTTETGVGAAPLVDSSWGRIAGTDVISPSGETYYAYLGIPFALPPVGALRFAKPVAHPGPGPGRVFNATSLGYICPQLELEVLSSFPAQSEDCLTLNVYTPASFSDGLRSVMIWIYGGGYFLGHAAAYTPSRLVLTGDVIVVTLQYRLAILGFLASGDEVSPGNYGLFDQTLAIRWVKDNIRAFGGNPDTITLFGQSAGAGSVGFQLLSPYARGLFQRGIMQSGTPLAYWAINKKPTEAMYRLARRTGCWDSQSWSATMSSVIASRVGASLGQYLRLKEHERMVRCLRELPVSKMVEFSTMMGEDGQPDYFQATPWTPVVDGDFVPRLPQELLTDMNYLLYHDVLDKDLLIGVNNNEGGYVPTLVPPPSQSGSSGDQQTAVDDDKSDDVFTAFAYFQAIDQTMENSALRAEVAYRFPELEKDENRLNTVVNVLSFFYIQPLENGQVNVQGVADTFADIYFTTGAVEMSRSLAKAAQQVPFPQQASGQRYLYLFDHFPASKAGQPLQGVNHGEDLFYQFDANGLFPQDAFTAEDFQVRNNFIDMLTDFAKNGNANMALGRQLGGDWSQYTLAEESYLSLSAQPRMKRQLYGNRISLWLDLLPSLVNSTRQESIGPGGWSTPANGKSWYISMQGRITKL